MRPIAGQPVAMGKMWVCSVRIAWFAEDPFHGCAVQTQVPRPPWTCSMTSSPYTVMTSSKRSVAFDSPNRRASGMMSRMSRSPRAATIFMARRCSSGAVRTSSPGAPGGCSGSDSGGTYGRAAEFSQVERIPR